MKENELVNSLIAQLKDNDLWFTTKNDPTIVEPGSYYELDEYGYPTEKAVKKLAKEIYNYIGDGAVYEEDAIELWVNDALMNCTIDYIDNLRTQFKDKPVVDQIEAYENPVQLAESKEVKKEALEDIPEGNKPEMKTCLYCKSKNLEYNDEPEHIEYNDYVSYLWTCKDCGKSGLDIFSLEFIGQDIFRDEENLSDTDFVEKTESKEIKTESKDDIYEKYCKFFVKNTIGADMYLFEDNKIVFVLDENPDNDEGEVDEQTFNSYKEMFDALDIQEAILNDYDENGEEIFKEFGITAKDIESLKESKEVDLSKDLFGKEADARRFKEHEDYKKHLQYVKDIMAGKTVIDDKYNKELDLETAKNWLKNDYIYINSLASFSNEEIDKRLARDLPEIFGNKKSEGYSKCLKKENVIHRLREENNKSQKAISDKITDPNFDSDSNEGKIILRTQELFNTLSDKGYDVQVSFDNGESQSTILLGEQGGRALITITNDNQPLRAFANGSFELTEANLEILQDIQNQIDVI